MRVLVLGAAGPLGTGVVSRLVARGDDVVAFVRRPGSPVTSRVVEVVGDARDQRAVRAAIARTDAVVDVIGAGTLARSHVESVVIANVVAVMNQLGPRRLIAMSAGMVARTNPLLDLVLKPTIFRHILAEHRRVEEIVSRSNLDWTIVRPPRLVSRRARGYATTTGTRYSGSVCIAREDVAAFIVDALARAAFIRQAVFVSSRRPGSAGQRAEGSRDQEKP
jgi:putative NADH-flavin reductase